MEYWSTGEMEKWRTSIFQFTQRYGIYQMEANTSLLLADQNLVVVK